VAGAVVADEVGLVVGPCVGWDEGGVDVGCCVGCFVGWDVGEDGECEVAPTPGGAWAVPFCHDSATYPPLGTCSAVTPAEAYFQVPDVPSDHHSDQ